MKNKYYLLAVIFIIFIGAFLFKNKLPLNQNHDNENNSLSQISEKDIKNYFKEITLGTEYNYKNSEKVIRKWEKNEVSIKKMGVFNEYLSNCLTDVATDFNKFSFETKLILNNDSDDIEIYLTPLENFKNIEPNYQGNNYGYFSIYWNEKNEIYKGLILINSNEKDRDKERCHLIREELTQSMGLGNDSNRYKDSIFYDEFIPTLKYSKIDKEIIKLLYSDKIIAGMNEADINNINDLVNFKEPNVLK